MTYVLLTPGMVEVLHDAVLNPGELPGRAGDKSLDGALARVDNRLAYGMIEDVFDLAAAYATAVATGRIFDDANKRTAYEAMIVCLFLNDVRIVHDTEEVGRIIISTALGLTSEDTLAAWLRARG